MSVILETAFAAYQRGALHDALAVLGASPGDWQERADAWLLLGVLRRATGQAVEAEQAYLQALRLKPDYADAWRNLGNLYAAAGHHNAAADALQRALNTGHDDIATTTTLYAASAFSAGHIDTALNTLQTWAGRDAGAANQLGKCLWELGRTEAAVAAFARAVALDSKVPLYAVNRLLVSQFSEHCEEADLAALAGTAAASIARSIDPELRATYRPPAPAADGRIRIAYLSSDFRHSAPGYFIHAILAGHDRTRFAVHALATLAGGDDWSQRLRALVDHYHEVDQLDDTALVGLIRSLGIDILVDLNGYTGGHRLGVIASRAAPLQVSWLGYEGTTQLPGMDALIGDWRVTPPEHDQIASERVVRLPFDFACYQAPDYAPPVADLPAMDNGHITFASFNKLAKLGPATLALWARVLHAVPDSRLLIKWRHATHASVRQPILETLGGQGIDPARIAFREATPHAQMLAEYGAVDIALDPFPFSGGATTCEALWMGVPVVSRLGRRFASNHSASHLASAGLPECIAASEDDYVAICQRLAGDLPALQRLRQALREQMRRSPLCDAHLFMLGVERHYRDLLDNVK